MDQREELLNSLKQRGFSQEIVNAFYKVRRDDFIPESVKRYAYQDNALPIGQSQTISQPYTIAMMLSLLDVVEKQKILEIGSGSGYLLALLSEMVGVKGKVFGIEIIKELADMSKKALKNYKNAKVFQGNGKSGLEMESPFDRIIISAATEEITRGIASQLKERGIIVAPIGKPYDSVQDLIAYEKVKGKLVEKKRIPGFLFVPLVG